MGFYEQISRYYDYIFPTGEAQVKFIRDSAGSPPGRILDVACGSGGYSIELSKTGYSVVATDLDPEMVRLAKEKSSAGGFQVEVFQADMLELEVSLRSRLDTPDFDCVFCIGNSLVHLGRLKDIENAISQMYRLLKPGGRLVLQIINFDRVAKYGINELPTLKNTGIGLEFIRRYERRSDRNTINFNTVLNIDGKDGKEVYRNSIELFPLSGTELMRVLQGAGFKSISFFGDFDGLPYSDEAFMLVVRAER